ncbi:hypothetical protein M885DRAFT_504529 [Pelagophyceae sp. CCMP2097]|nr:hypothetical protein M885DRAFT_504529 [Pelagophyceae sp. CCMP2097]
MHLSQLVSLLLCAVSSLAPARRAPRAATARRSTEDAETADDALLKSNSQWNAKQIDRLGDLAKLAEEENTPVLKEEVLLAPTVATAAELMKSAREFQRQQVVFKKDLEEVEAKGIEEIRFRTGPITKRISKEQRNLKTAVDRLQTAKTDLDEFKTQAQCVSRRPL